MKLTTNLTVENLLKNEKWTSQFDTPQLNMIQSGLQQGYDVSIYAKPDLDVYQMRVILYCLYYTYDELARNLSKTSNFNPDEMMSYLKFLINTSHGAQHK
jgi:hypothetical protein